VRIVSRSPLRAEVVGREEVEEYWGYGVEVRTIEEVLDDARFPLKIATSRLGDPLRTAMPRLKTALQEKSPLMFVFGSPSRGLFDLAGPRLRRRTSFVINLFSEQHVRTVRTEEALFAALNLLNFQSF
jgi:predicted SPOUT superfamily RNA methylase MTH1